MIFETPQKVCRCHGLAVAVHAARSNVALFKRFQSCVRKTRLIASLTWESIRRRPGSLRRIRDQRPLRHHQLVKLPHRALGVKQVLVDGVGILG